jgi:uncharacterized protein YhbP (UPF0306 family)
MLRERVEKYLAEHTTLNLATYGPGGLWSCAVLYIHDGVNLYFTTVHQTRHGININTSNVVAGTINDDCKSWETMAGIQLGGVVEKVTDYDERRRVVRAYLAKYPFSTALWHGEHEADMIALDPRGHDFYRITPKQLLFTDNTYAPGKRQELVLA